MPLLFHIGGLKNHKQFNIKPKKFVNLGWKKTNKNQKPKTKTKTKPLYDVFRIFIEAPVKCWERDCAPVTVWEFFLSLNDDEKKSSKIVDWPDQLLLSN